MSNADRRVRAKLVLGGLRWRAGASLAMFVVAEACGRVLHLRDGRLDDAR